MTAPSALEKLKAKVIADAAATKVSAPPATPQAPQAAPVTPTLPEVKEEVFQFYKSTIDNQKIAMKSGKVLRITAGKYITKDPAEIEFLDYEISQGFPFLKKGEPVTSSDLDPMSALRKKIYAEILAAQADGTLAVPAPVLGNTAQQAVVPASTSDLAPLSAGSVSQA